MPRGGSERLQRGQSENAAGGGRTTRSLHGGRRNQHSAGGELSSAKSPTRGGGGDGKDDMDISNPAIPEDLRHFLKDIAIPPQEEETEEEKAEREVARRKHLTEVKSKIDTGGGGGGTGGGGGGSGGNSRANSKKVRGSVKSNKKKKPPNLNNLDDCSNESGPETNSPRAGDGSSDESASISESARRRKGSARFSEYEITLMWNQCKMNFSSGRVNNVQLAQMLQQVFPKCEHDVVESVSRNIMYVFDRGDAGTVAFRDLLIAFSLTMKGDEMEKLEWMYKFYDEEEDAKLGVDTDDMAKVIARLCEFSRNSEDFARMGREEYFRVRDEEAEKEKERERERARERERERERRMGRMAEGEGGTPSRKPGSGKGDDGMRLMSNRMGERAGAVKTVKKRNHQETKKEESPLKLTEEEEKAKEKLEEQLKLEKEKSQEVVRHFDRNRDGFVSSEEFVRGCIEAEVFDGLIQGFRGDLLWGDLMSGR